MDQRLQSCNDRIWTTVELKNDQRERFLPKLLNRRQLGAL